MTTEAPALPLLAPGPLNLEDLSLHAQKTPGRSLRQYHTALRKGQYVDPACTRRLVALEMPERGAKGLQSSLKSHAEGLGWTYVHFNDSRREVRDKDTGAALMVGDKDARYWPDTVLIRGPRLLFVELKREDQDVDGGQLEMLAQLIVAGQDVFVLRPSGLQAMLAVLS